MAVVLVPSYLSPIFWLPSKLLGSMGAVWWVQEEKRRRWKLLILFALSLSLFLLYPIIIIIIILRAWRPSLYSSSRPSRLLMWREVSHTHTRNIIKWINKIGPDILLLLPWIKIRNKFPPSLKIRFLRGISLLSSYEYTRSLQDQFLRLV